MPLPGTTIPIKTDTTPIIPTLPGDGEGHRGVNHRRLVGARPPELAVGEQVAEDVPAADRGAAVADLHLAGGELEAEGVERAGPGGEVAVREGQSLCRL